MFLLYTLKRAGADHTLAPQRPWFQIIESRQKVFLCSFLMLDKIRTRSPETHAK